jgi:hypothetical protein
VIYGLDKDGESVRGEVFASKMVTLVKALQVADSIANGGRRHILVVDDLQKHSAQVRLREKLSTRKRVIGTGSATLGRAFASVYQGGVRAAEVPNKLLNFVEKLAEGAEETFSHADAYSSKDEPIRIDRFFVGQVASAQRDRLAAEEAERDAHYSGSCLDTFDGVLKVIDKRGALPRVLLTLTSGGRTIDCVLKQDLLRDALEKFDLRVSVEGLAIYRDADLLPQRIEIQSIRVIKSDPDVSRWRGMFKIPAGFDDDWSSDFN